MISWIVATHDTAVLEANLLVTLQPGPGDEVIVVEDAPSIAQAYTDGQARASQPIRCYVHHDVQVLDNARLRLGLKTRVAQDIGMVGLVGCVDGIVPWWDGQQLLGSIRDARVGELNHGMGGPCAFVDGLLLATVHEVAWDLRYPGWHMYDHDVCAQMIEAGRTNWCLTGGKDMVLHNTTGSLSEVDGWDEHFELFRAKWANVSAPPIEG